MPTANPEETAETQRTSVTPQVSPNRLKHREAYRKIGQAITALERDWRIALGKSPNPWGGDNCHDPSPRGGTTRVMQIISRHKMSKLEMRSLADSPEPEKPQ